MTGFYLVPRGKLDSPVFGNSHREPFCKRAAFLWMVERACTEQTKAMVEGQETLLSRGEFSASIRDMGGEWGWDTTKVARFVSVLFHNRFIATRKIGRQFVISVCDYDQFSSHEQSTNRTHETIVERSWNDNSVDASVGASAVSEAEEVRKVRERTPSIEGVNRAQIVAHKMVEIWKEELTGTLSVPMKLTASRIAVCQRRWRDSFGQDVERWRAYCQSIRGSPFLCGEKGWKADFDWATKVENIVHVEEGRYEEVNGHGYGSRAGAHSAQTAAFDEITRQ